MKLRKNLSAIMAAGLLALSAVACSSDTADDAASEVESAAEEATSEVSEEVSEATESES